VFRLKITLVIEALPGARDTLEKLHVRLQSVAGLGLLVPLPALGMRSVLLVGREPAKFKPHGILARSSLVYRLGSVPVFWFSLTGAGSIRRDPAMDQAVF
jgi:hypothetical protein